MGYRPFIGLALTILVCGCHVAINGMPAIQGSGTVITESRDLAAFTELFYGGSGTLRIVQGAPARISITCDDNLLPLIETEVDDQSLTIRSTERISPSSQLTFDVICPDIRVVRLSGSGDATLDRTEGQRLDIGLAGSGNVTVGHATNQHVEIALAGSGSVVIAGNADNVRAKITGSGSLDCRELSAEAVDVKVTGSGNARLHARESFIGKVTGSGNVQCAGSPSKKSQTITGSGRISFSD